MRTPNIPQIEQQMEVGFLSMRKEGNLSPLLSRAARRPHPPSSIDRVSLSTPSTEGCVEAQENEEAVSSKVSLDHCTNCPNPSSSKWLPEELKICGELVGLSVSKCEKGWENLIQFGEACQRKKKEISYSDKSRRKGS